MSRECEEPETPMSPMSKRFRWIQVTERDVEAIFRISEVVHPSFPEDIGVFRNRLEMYPSGFYALVDTEVFPRADENYIAIARNSKGIEKLSASPIPHTCGCAESEEHEFLSRNAVQPHVVGYSIFHPWEANDAPPLDFQFDRPEDVPKTPAEAEDPEEHAKRTWLYWHDCAILPSVRNSGGGKAIVRIILDFAEKKQFTHVALTSVNNSGGYWQSRGFEAVPRPQLTNKMKIKLDTHYGTDSLFMVNRLEAEQIQS